jgi:sugar transferase EpsL
MSGTIFPSGVPKAKRLLDLGLSIIGLVVLSPLMAMIAGLVYSSLRRPIFFRQLRPGLHGKPFVLLKFRTMRDLQDKRGALLPDEERLTSLGRLLRSLSLDDLPNLLNVVWGDMSLVGPRPLLMAYLGRYTSEQARRHEVLPGITGWAQIHGRNVLSWERKFELDVWYVDHWSLALDLRILLITIWKVIKREGISQPGRATAEEFSGSDDSEV